MKKPVLLLNVVGLSPRHLERGEDVPRLAALAQEGQWRPMRPTFPAVTCSVQASLLSGFPPEIHGIVANGYFDRKTYEVKFWEQPDALVQAPRIWDWLKARDRACKTAVLFWQNSMFIDSDVVVTPRPLHLESGLVQWCYSKPAGFYEEVAAKVGPFKLQHYWGPLAGLQSSEWIAACARYTWEKKRPDFMAVYLPHLDYAAQKYGPESSQARQALREVDRVAGRLLELDAVRVVVSEYSLTPVRRVIYPNRLLRRAGLLRVREIAGKEYLDFELSDAFAMVDHQVAHVFCRREVVAQVRSLLADAHPVDFMELNHPRAGELVVVAPADEWFAYYWWEDWAKAPEFAFTVDIHRKPGYDPCELWFDWRRMARTFRPQTGTDPTVVKGSHGRVDNDPAGWAVLVADEQAAAELPKSESLCATDVAPLLYRLMTGETATG
ncbi:MAG: alkaline phosphatase family protein [Verrucomicrobiae bacterium]|nr:alkaline phosphatase family protein [Verrucomicrobiae bacterium]